MRLRTTAPAVLLSLAAPLGAAPPVQGPSAPWKTIRTVHYRIHYPARGDFQPFAEEVASRIEGIHRRVTELVGYESPRIVDVLLRDPVLRGNGSAYPFLAQPYVELWKTPPEPESAVGHFRSWPELVVAHELAHIHHLTRPQNHPRWTERLLDQLLGPVARKAPRWAIEGYATVIEGKATGSGRPHGAYRAAVIRQWALEGKLPDYGDLSLGKGFRGGSMAYLVGSAFLEWLERNNPADPAILKKFWMQLASKKRRNFDRSFRATFGMGPRDGYDRWRAEATHDALELERQAKDRGLLREGELWARIPGEVTDLQVDATGGKLLARVLTKGFKGLQVWSLAEKGHPPGPAATPKNEAPDPQEVEDRKPAVPPRKARWTLGRLDGRVPERPAWDGGDIVFELHIPDQEGILQKEPMRWTPGSAARKNSRTPAVPGDATYRWEEREGTWNLVRRGEAGRPGQLLTRTLSAAWNPAPTPDGRWLYYTQLTAEGCDIRRLDLSLPPLREVPLPADPPPLTAATILPPGDAPSSLPLPVASPEAQDYRASQTLWTLGRMGTTVAPSGTSYELGAGGTDLLGRFSWLALGAFGNGAGPRGAMAGFTYRGWAPAVGFHAFSSLERPSSQRYDPVPGFDRQRTGAEATLTFESRDCVPRHFRPVVAFERVAFQGPAEDLDRRFAGVDAGISAFWGRGESWGLALSAKGAASVGRTGDRGWRQWRGGLHLNLANPAMSIFLHGEAGRIGGRPTALDLFHLGGLSTSLAPASLEWNRVAQPALPSYRAAGDRMERWRLGLGTGLRAYLEVSAVWMDADPRPSHTRVAGLELDLEEWVGRPEVLDRLLGKMNLVAGVHRILRDPGAGPSLRGQTVATLSLVLRP